MALDEQRIFLMSGRFAGKSIGLDSRSGSGMTTNETDNQYRSGASKN